MVAPSKNLCSSAYYDNNDVKNRCPVEPHTAGREAVDTIDVLNGGIQNHILPDEPAVFQVK